MQLDLLAIAHVENYILGMGVNERNLFGNNFALEFINEFTKFELKF